MVGAEAHVGVGREVEDEIVPLHGLGQAGFVQHVPFDQPEARLEQRLGQEAPLPGREVVVSRDGMAVGQEPVYQIAADETGSAGDEVTRHSAT